MHRVVSRKIEIDEGGCNTDNRRGFILQSKRKTNIDLSNSLDDMRFYYNIVIYSDRHT